MCEYGPTPLTESESLKDYARRFQEWVEWRLRATFYKTHPGTNDVGQERIQFHLNSDGKIYDVKILTNTLGEKPGDLYREAILAGAAFEPWPKEACRRRRAGYFMFRAALRIESVASSDLDRNRIAMENLEARLALPGDSMSNRVEKMVLTNFQTDPAFLMNGLSEGQTNNLAGAIVDFTRAIDWDAGDAWAYTFRGRSRNRVKDYVGAMADLTKAIELDPENAEALNERSVTRLHFKDYTGMVSDCTKAIELDPNYAAAYDNRGRAETRLHDFDRALTDINKAVEYGPTNAIAFLNRARLRYWQHNYDSAMMDCSKAVELNSRYAAAYAFRGCIQEELSDYRGAIESLKRSLELDNSLDYSRFQIWITRSKLGEMSEANRELRSHIQNRPPEKKLDWPYKVESFLAGSLSEDEFLKAAREPAQTAQERIDHICEAAYYAGIKHLFSNDKFGAAKLFQECISTSDQDFIEYLQAQRELKSMTNQRDNAARSD